MDANIHENLTPPNSGVQYKNAPHRNCWQRMLNLQPSWQELPDRCIVTNVPDQSIEDNLIVTSQYTYFTFLPINLFQQFTKPSNAYFLLIGIMQTIPAITVSEGKPTMFFPLTIVVLISMLKDFVEDRKRHLSDLRENNEEVEILGQFGFKVNRWQNIRVGDVIRVSRNSYFPCDILLLQHGKEGKLAFVQTKNLDGQTNLKLRKVPDCLSEQIQQGCDFYSMRLEIHYEKPNPYLSSFNGNMRLQGKKHPLNSSNIILRGCSLKINSYAIGVCLYSGHRTKILLNSGIVSKKKSQLQHDLNGFFKFIFGFQILVTFISSLAYGVILEANKGNLGYINESSNYVQDIVATWGSWFINFSNFIPISLLVTVEIVRYGQGYFISIDDKCKSKMVYSEVQASCVNEELGQIEFLLSDKTGTLTQNKMDFKCLYTNSKNYGSLQPHQEPDDRMSSISVLKDENQLKEINLNPHSNFLLLQKERIIRDIEMQKVKKFQENHQQSLNEHTKPQEKSVLGNRVNRVQRSLIHLAVCHNVICEGGRYNSSSPDQIALVNFAKFIGYEFMEKQSNNTIIIKINKGGQITSKKFQVLQVLQFSSDRRRMSVIVKDIDSKSIILMCKGADDVIIPRLTQKSLKMQNEEKINTQLSHYGREGLRTLVLCQRLISENQYLRWQKDYNQALSMITHERYQLIMKLQSQIERHFDFVGITAIQDKLQHGVKDTIKSLLAANIKTWMLTGDKKETAISIGYACGLIDSKSQKIVLDCGFQYAEEMIDNLLRLMPLIDRPKVTIISGDFIRKISLQAKLKLSSILRNSKAVICCRVSPREKEYLTSMAKQWGSVMAVGDGANDVNMINVANVGVGVRGIQGSQAIRAADYVIGEFQIIKPLLFYYGSNCYHRNATVMHYTIYKNILITLPILFYGPLSMQSATYIYDNWIFQFYNILYVSLPIIYYGLFDVLFSEQQLQLYPNFYKNGQKGTQFNAKLIGVIIGEAIILSVIMIILGYYGTEMSISSNGYMVYEEWSGMLIFTAIVFIVNIRIIALSNQITPLLLILAALGVITYYIVAMIIQAILYTDGKGTLLQQLSTPIYYVMLLIFIILAQGFNSGFKEFLKKDIKTIQIPQQKSRRESAQDSTDKKIHGYAFAEDEQRSVHMI